MRFVCLVSFVVLSFGFCFADRVITAPKYVIDLDLPPEQRWAQVGKIYSTSAPAIVDYFTHQLPLPGPVIEIIEFIAANMDFLLPDGYGKEIRGVAKAMDVPLGLLVTLNFAYELRRLGGGHPNVTTAYEPKACTSVVAEDNNEVIFHGRNLDWNLPDPMRNLTFQATFVKGNQTLFTGQCICGFIGILTGVKVTEEGSWAGSIDERDLGGSPILDALEAIVRRAWSPTHLLRHTFENFDTYKDALSELTNKKLSAPVYYIISGDQHAEGAVITRDRNSAADVWTLWDSDKSLPGWFRLETNYDHWLPPPPTDARSTYGIKYMTALGRDNLNLDSLYTIMNTWPVNNNFTSITAMMCPKQGTMTTYIHFTQ